MALPPTSASFYADPTSFSALKKGAADQDPKALREAARQFESIFTQMMLKSMRDANKTFAATDSPLSSEQGDFYREMFDNQIAMQLSKGKGLGLADLLVKQLQSKTASTSNGDAASSETRDTRRVTGQSFLPLPKDAPIAATQGAISPQISKEDIAAQFAALVSRTQQSGISGPREAPNASNVDLGNVEAADAADSAPTRHASGVTRHDAVDSHEKTTSSTSTSATNVLANSPADFISQLWPHAQAVGKELGVDPRTLIAHAALETGWGKNIPCNPDGTCSFNLFGIKAGGHWRGSVVGVNTLEYENGMAVQKRAGFRAYDSVADSFRDYASLIKSNPRYAAALQSGSDASAFATALQQGGYATDPNYASKLASVADRLNIAFKSDSHRPLALGRSVSSGGET